MNAIMNKTMEKRKLLAAIAVLALAMCAFVAFVPAGETDAVDATSVPAVGEDGKITVDKALELNCDATITNGLVLNAALTIPETATLTINYAFQASETGTNESVITFGENGQLIVEGNVIINASNESGYTPGSGATNHILYKTGDYSSSADIQVKSGSLEMNMDKAVKGALNNGKFYLDVEGGNVKFNGNSVTTMYIVQDGGSVEFAQKDGSVMAYIDMNAGSMTVSGTNTTGAAAATPNPYIFVPYAMDIASNATLNVNGAMSIYTKQGGAPDSTLPSGHGLKISTVTNAGKINVNASGSIDVPAGATMTLGTINSSGNVDVTVDENGIKAALENPAVDNIVYNSTTPITQTINKNVTVTSADAISGAKIGDNGAVTLAPAEEDGTVTIDNKTVNFVNERGDNIGSIIMTDVTASKIGFFYGSAGVYFIDGQGTVEITGDGKIYGSVAAGQKVTISNNSDTNATVNAQDTITLGDGSTLEIGTSVVLNAADEIGLAEDADSATIIVKGTFAYTSLPAGITLQRDGGVIKVEGGQGTENIISTSQTIDGTYYLTADTVIENNVTLTVGRNATLDLMGFKLTVNGTLVIENRGTVTTKLDGGSIELMSTSVITNNGTIGNNQYGIKLTNGMLADGAAEQSVTMVGVSGVSVGLDRSLNNAGDRVYTMVVSGDVSRISSISTHELTLTNVTVNADMSIGRDVTVKASDITVTGNGTVFTMDGELMTITDSFLLKNGTSFVVSAPVTGTITAETGTVGDDGAITSDGTAETVVFTNNTVVGSDEVNDYIIGITISVGRATEVDPEDPSESIVYQRMYVSGNLSATTDSKSSDYDANGSIGFTGDVYVDGTLVIPEEIGITSGSDYTFVVDGAGMVSAVENENLNYSGAMYSVETTANAQTTETFYYTTFAAAMEQIGTATDGIVQVAGSYTISGEYTVGDDQEITLKDESGIVVGEDAEITVSADGSIDDKAFYTILGAVVALEGTGYTPEPTIDAFGAETGNHYIYAVMAVDEETNDTRYSGFKVAMDAAASGQTITVVGDAVYDGNLVIPAGVTVTVEDTIALAVTGNVTIEAEGTLNLGAQSTLTVGEDDRNSTVTVSGKLDATDGGIIAAAVTTNDDSTTSNATVNIYSTGELTTTSPIATTEYLKVNAAYYRDGEYTYTSVAKAIAYAEENALTGVNAVGTFSETGAIESDGVDIAIAAGANVTLGDVTLNNATIGVTGTGVYTATVSGLTGAGDAATTSTVSVNKTNATIESDVTVDAQGVSNYAFTLGGIRGATTVMAGTVEYAGEYLYTSKDNSLTIASGATLLVGEDSRIYLAGSHMTNNGTFQIDGDVTVNGPATLDGNVVIADTGSLVSPETYSYMDSDEESQTADLYLIVTGDVTVEADGVFSVWYLQVGETPELLGSATTGSIAGEVTLNGVAYVFNGASAAETDFVSTAGDEVNTTTYTINGLNFVTVYTFGNEDIASPEINNYVCGLEDLATTVIDENERPVDMTVVWYSGEQNVGSDYVGEYETVSTEIRYNSVPVTISVGSHITLSIDNVIYDYNGVNTLSIGTHTVSVVIDPGFSGDVTITFNGQTISNGGQINVTSDMINALEYPVLSVTGSLTQDSTVVIDGGESGDSGMGLTDYLLIILVILIVVMAIMVAMRLMRS